LQVHSNGQSLSVVQVGFSGWHVPGNDVVVTQVLVVPASAATGGSAAPLPPPTPDETVPPLALPAEAEHTPWVSGWQTKPSPQSVLALHGSSHL
jgi:hypothetical protein